MFEITQYLALFDPDGKISGQTVTKIERAKTLLHSRQIMCDKAKVLSSGGLQMNWKLTHPNLDEEFLFRELSGGWMIVVLFEAVEIKPHTCDDPFEKYKEEIIAELTDWYKENK